LTFEYIFNYYIELHFSVSGNSFSNYKLGGPISLAVLKQAKITRLHISFSIDKISKCSEQTLVK